MAASGWLDRAGKSKRKVVPAAAALSMAARPAALRATRGSCVDIEPERREAGSWWRFACMFRYARKSRLSWRQMVINGSEVGCVYMCVFIVCVFVNKGGNWPRMGGRFAVFLWCR